MIWLSAIHSSKISHFMVSLQQAEYISNVFKFSKYLILSTIVLSLVYPIKAEWTVSQLPVIIFYNSTWSILIQ